MVKRFAQYFSLSVKAHKIARQLFFFTAGNNDPNTFITQRSRIQRPPGLESIQIKNRSNVGDLHSSIAGEIHYLIRRIYYVTMVLL